MLDVSCVGFRPLWRATALRGKEPGVGSCSDVSARKAKKAGRLILFGCVDAALVAPWRPLTFGNNVRRVWSL
jgi:hypothetical protein